MLREAGMSSQEVGDLPASIAFKLIQSRERQKRQHIAAVLIGMRYAMFASSDEFSGYIREVLLRDKDG